jgi:hypothetical protein
MGRGDGSFGPPLHFFVGGYGGRYLTVADLNGNAEPDLVVTGYSYDVRLLLGWGDGAFLGSEPVRSVRTR